MRLIDADELKPDMKIFTSAYSTELTECYSLKAINNAPTIEAAPVRNGEWVYDEYDIPHCSECGKEPKEISPFCPNCGAKMETDGGDDKT